MKSFINLVTAKMTIRSLSLRKVAREAGLDPSFLSKVLAGKRSPPSDEKVLTRLARCLGIDPAVLVISTGTIPSELRPLMEKPEFLKNFLGKSRKSFPGLAAERSAGNSGTHFPNVPKNRKKRSLDLPKSPHLSEDLL